MGFGLLFLGYIVVFCGAFAPQISAFSYILGSGVVLFSLKKLIDESKLFVSSAILAFLLELFSIISVVIQLFVGAGTLSSVFSYTVEALAIALNVLLMLSILFLAKSVELPHLVFMSSTNISFIALGAALFVACELVTVENVSNGLTVIYYATKLVYTVLGLVIIFNSYMRICYEGDENMQQTKTGNPLFDKLNELSDKAFSRKNKGGKK